MTASLAHAAILGTAVGDALGVPVEFTSRAERDADPVTDLRAYGTHHQPAGTWSDDTSMMLCLTESLCTGLDSADVGTRFVRWAHDAEWTPHGTVFDIGNTTAIALRALARGDARPGRTEASSNGNGSLMRTIPIALALRDHDAAGRHTFTMEVSALTHAHPRSCLACVWYVELCRLVAGGAALPAALAETRVIVRDTVLREHPGECEPFARLLDDALLNAPRNAIRSSGYVIDTLEAALWCCATTNDYATAVLTAVNLGDDTDTTGAVTGGLAALLHGVESIPAPWRDALARRDDLIALADRAAAAW